MIIISDITLSELILSSFVVVAMSQDPFPALPGQPWHWPQYKVQFSTLGSLTDPVEPFLPASNERWWEGKAHSDKGTAT